MHTSKKIKGCFILQRRFVYVGHEIVRILQRDHRIDEFCAFVQTRTSHAFLSEQKDIRYSKLLLDEDIQRRFVDEPLDLSYLKTLEREYGIPNLWPYINVDRIIRFGQLVREYPYDTPPYTHEEMLRMLQVYAKAIIAFLDEEKPDFLFSAPLGGMGTVLLHHIAKKRGIRTLVMAFPGIRDRIAVSERYDRLTFVESIVARDREKKISDIPQYEEARAFIKEFRERPRVYSEIHEPSRRKFSRIQHFGFLHPARFFPMVAFLFEKLAEQRRQPLYRGDYSYVRPLGFFIDAVRRKMRNLVGSSDLYDAYDPSVPFVFFPLHLEPELSLLLLARFDTDQIGVVRRVAQSLPVGVKLVVKEHPQMVVSRPRAFYKTLKKIPNVVLIRPEIPGFDVIARAALVTVITGTAGWEATLFGKPVVTFGDAFYNPLPSVVRSRIPEELPEEIAKMLSTPAFDEEGLVRFVAAIFEDSAHADILNIWELGGDEKTRDAELAGLAALIAKKL